MGRPPSNGGPSFRFNPTEVAEMDAILQAHNVQMPSREILVSLAEKFSTSAERSGKVVIQMKQVWNWFQNRRYALRAKEAKVPGKLSVSPVPRDDLTTVRNVPQAPQHLSVPPAIVRSVPQAPQPIPAASVQSAARNVSDSSQMEFEAKSARDGAWYDVATFISHRSVESSDPEVLVRFAGFGPEEDEWVNVRKHVRQRSLPCESSECIAVLPGDLILCFQEGKEQALYFDAHVLDAQRRRHDVRGCRCRFLVRYDHDQSEEIVPLRKVCRRPETDYRLQQLHAESANANRSKTGSEPHTGNTVKVYSPAEAVQKQHKVDSPAEAKEPLPKAEAHANIGPVTVPVSHATVSMTIAAVPNADANTTSADIIAPVAHSSASVATATAPVAKPNNSGATVSVATTTTPVAHSNVSKATDFAVTATNPVAHSSVSGATSSAVTTMTPVENFNISGATVSTTTPVANPYVSGTTSVVATTLPGENSNVSGAINTTSFANSNDSGVTNSIITTTIPVVNSNFSGAPGVDPVAHSDTPPDVESKVLPENVSETAATNSLENTSAVLANTSVTSSATDTATRSMVTGSSSEKTLQG